MLIRNQIKKKNPTRFVKNFLIIIFLIILIGAFGINVFNVRAVTIDKIQISIQELETQIAQLQRQLQQQLTDTCHTVPVWDWDYCATDCKCKSGQGDCDGDFHCLTGFCALDVGAKYGQDKWIDVCEYRPGAEMPGAEEKIEEEIPKELLSEEMSQPDVSEEITEDVLIQEPLIFPEDMIFVFLTADSPVSSAVAVGDGDVPVLEFRINNPFDEVIAVEKISLILEGDVGHDVFGAVYWKINKDTLLGKSYFGQVLGGQSFTSIFNLPVYENEQLITKPLFEINPNTADTLRVSVDIKTEPGNTGTFQFSLLKDLLELKIQNYNIAGLPIKSNLMTIVRPDCFDSDAGINEYIFGKTSKAGITNYDACIFGDNLKEWVCTGAGKMTHKLIECLDGCVDGVCKKPTGNDPSTGVVCIDSTTEGKDYETFGRVTHGDGNILSKDSCEDETTLREYYCQNGYVVYELHQCPIGCQYGACLSEAPLKNVENQLAAIFDLVSWLIKQAEELVNE